MKASPRGRLRRARWLLVMLPLLLPAGSAPAQSGFVADLSDHLIAITTGFRGTSVLLFGAVREPGGDIAVVVRGPEADVLVRRKERHGPLWLEGETMRIAAAPSFYAVAASRPLAELDAATELARHEIGVDHLHLETSGGETADATFRAAFIRARQRGRLFPAGVTEVSFLGEILFRTRVVFPAHVPPGTYEVEVFQLMRGRVIHAQKSVLQISKVGLEAELSDFAAHRSLFYGLVSVLLAVAAGWSAALVFRRS